jgi:hypothetical protein
LHELFEEYESVLLSLKYTSLFILNTLLQKMQSFLLLLGQQSFLLLTDISGSLVNSLFTHFLVILLPFGIKLLVKLSLRVIVVMLELLPHVVITD